MMTELTTAEKVSMGLVTLDSLTTKELAGLAKHYAEKRGTTAPDTYHTKADALARVEELMAEPATTTVDQARAAKWGFGSNVEAYRESVRLQAEMRKAKASGDAERYAKAHAAFREANRGKKQKYA